MPTDICAATVGIQAVGLAALPDRAAWINEAAVRGKSHAVTLRVYCIELAATDRNALFALQQRH